ncbi:MAG: cofactor-independent phosphoglycerate mutase [Methanoregulaceae archaeon]|jgi:2,3-bisphosphoglycerate-independent phosphoglycerate mutase|nr:cofactor-independent phosphoglycerate mutase [Methanoregulaceae archaeon]
MKVILILADGMADEPLPELGNQTPLEYAKTPNMDRLAREGACGMLRTVPEGCEPGSDIANLSILGYDPATYYTGRGPLEAESMGVTLGPEDIAYRCNLVTIENGIMADFSAGHISSPEGASLIASLEGRLPEGILMKAGISYRNLLVVRKGAGAVTIPPHDIVGSPIYGYLPRDGDAGVLGRCMQDARRVFVSHPVNTERIRGGLPPATDIWPWSGGKRPQLPPFRERYGRTGGMISAVDLLNGIARCAGMEIIRVPGATGYLDTDYEAKTRFALDALGHLDFVYVHVEAPDEAGHLGSIEEKVRAIERVDEMCGMVLNAFSGVIAVLPDHPTPVRIRTHTADPVPFVIHGGKKDNTRSFSEREAANGGYGLCYATGFLPLLFGLK